MLLKGLSKIINHLSNYICRLNKAPHLKNKDEVKIESKSVVWNKVSKKEMASYILRQDRAMSHGCIRLSQPHELAAYVLESEDDSWTLDRVKQLVGAKERKVIHLKNRYHFTFFTALH